MCATGYVFTSVDALCGRRGGWVGGQGKALILCPWLLLNVLTTGVWWSPPDWEVALRRFDLENPEWLVRLGVKARSRAFRDRCPRVTSARAHGQQRSGRSKRDSMSYRATGGIGVYGTRGLDRGPEALRTSMSHGMNFIH